ncbi:MAG: DUF86 domain-containing protein [Candidatus Syntrophonatronum acetioxidans]|uniref:DUF86 domain-containing protein n=1 Tax=Candidatus Syntrophonatronum acetioxidans TaxID=1795816 RepID=A0A424YA63_9FIRM|nr:MAG: DUF86 domain-containing protein [Candidatus Syntrophonatronum acetioxidans]
MKRNEIEIIQEKLAALQPYSKELKLLQGVTLEEYCKNNLYRRTTERLIQLIIEAATVINNMIVKGLGKEVPSDYYSSFFKMAEVNVFPVSFALEITPSAGLRNIIVHEYQKIDDVIVHGSMRKVLDYYLQYMNYVNDFLENKMTDGNR